MIFEQHYLECLSQASYFIGDESSKRATVVDPRRDISLYLDTAAEHGMATPLTRLNERLASLDASKPTVVYCAGGFRSSIAASRLAAAGFGDVADLLGGFGAWQAAHDDAGVVPTA